MIVNIKVNIRRFCEIRTEKVLCMVAFINWANYYKNYNRVKNHLALFDCVRAHIHITRYVLVHEIKFVCRLSVRRSCRNISKCVARISLKFWLSGALSHML